MTTAEPITVLVVDDQPPVREALRYRLQAQAAPRFKIIGEAGGHYEAFELARQVHPHLMVIDINLGMSNGLFLAREILKHYPEIRVLIWSGYSTASYLAEAKAAGIRGYVLKSCPTEELVRALGVVAAGGSYYSAAIEPPPEPLPRLTLTEMRILHLVAAWKKTGEIAKQLKISGRTVETHRRNIMEKLDATCALSMVVKAYRLGLIELIA